MIRPGEEAFDSAAPEGVALYAVGDVHGRIDLLDELLELIIADAGSIEGGERLRLVFLGDYVDRAPNARAVIERMVGLSSVQAVTCLRGNHEQVLLDFLDDPAVGPEWSRFGGEATLRSYGVASPRDLADPRVWRVTRDALAAAIPAAHLAWLRALPTSFEAGDYLFVHAGIRPGRALIDQTDADRLWIREPFLSWRGAHEKAVVHGHTAQAEPHLGRWRIGVDTGAYATGRLTAVRLLGTSRKLLQTSAGGDKKKGLRSLKRRP